MRAGGIYFIRCRDAVKIGWAVDVAQRCRELQTGSPDALSILATTAGDRRAEKELHRQFNALRVRGEWFRFEEPLVAFIHTCQSAKAVVDDTQSIARAADIPFEPIEIAAVEERAVDAGGMTVRQRELAALLAQLLVEDYRKFPPAAEESA